MAHASLAPQAISRQTVGAALAEARRKCADNMRWLAALNRAALNLEACQWAFDGQTLSIASATDAGRYHVTAQMCECKAAQNGRPCWHRAAARLLEHAAELAQPAPTPQPRIAPNFIDLQAAADELFA
jgi:hypothetical protein